MPATGRTISLEQQLRTQLTKVTDQQTRDLVRAWATAWDEVAPDLQAALADALGAGGDVTKAQLLRSKRLTRALGSIAKQLEDLTAETGVRITSDLQKVINDAGRAQARLIASQLPTRQDLVDLDAWSQISDRQIAAIVKRSTQQITSMTRPLSKVAAQAVRQELIRGVAAGSNPNLTARRMVARANTAFNGGLSRAMTIARTETLDAHRAGAALGQAQHADVLTGWTWLASISERTCQACWGMNGTVHALTEPGPSGHQNCRCARVPTTKSWSELGIEGVKEPPSVLPDADAVFAKLNPAQQQAILGRRGYAAWKAGKFPRSKWAVAQKNPGWRESFVPARPPKVKDLPPKRRPSAKKNPLATVPKINPELLANMEKRGIDVVEWNRRATNPLFATDEAYQVNCQRVVQAYELRRRGYDVTAKPNPGDGSGQARVFMKWLDRAEERSIESGRYLVSPATKRLVAEQDEALAAKMVTNAERYVTDVVKSWPVGARGWVTFYRDAGAGHIFNVERTATGVRVIEAQVPLGGENIPLRHYMDQVRMTRRRSGFLRLEGHSVFVTRVDDLEFNSGVLEAITWTG